ncbi:tetratricopeptide repeat protein [Sphaerochaeta sp. PS]|uniref:tetratricopeptide repeat protein n=1 Tax=Sphaerochaeta sp. PS TaxID=3076336 RepID=UPI0028A34314|nr:tetratricopeptide repeat protein [Sphaerochaeta sp. PS]MDT4763326.1 tetratricopeptide repeat protein [Sphaerochaeta sp. PS]
MTQPNKALENLVFIRLPSSMERNLDGFRIDPSIEIPIQLPAGQTSLEATSDISIELLVAGMLKIIAFDPDHKNFSYYRDFVLTVQQDAVQELNLAAIAQEQKGNFDFAEELFLTVNHLAPMSATFINLATFYSKRAALDSTKGTAYDFYQQKAMETLKEGVSLFEDDAQLLSELGFFHLYQGNVEIAKEYLDRFLEVAEPGEKRTHVEKIMGDINNKLNNDKALMQAYDQIQMGKEEEALGNLELYLAENPKVWNAWFLKGWALRRLSRFEEAEKPFLTCLTLGESSSDIYNELSICALETGKTALAKNYLNTAIDLEETNLTLLSNLAYLHLKDEEWDEAREFLELARNIDQNDPVIVRLMNDYEQTTGEKLSDPIVQQFVDTSELKEKEHSMEKKENPFFIQGKEGSAEVEVSFEEMADDETGE